MRISDKLQEIDIWREKLRSKLLSDLDPTEVYQEVMTSQQVLDHVTEKPNLFHAAHERIGAPRISVDVR